MTTGGKPGIRSPAIGEAVLPSGCGFAGLGRSRDWAGAPGGPGGPESFSIATVAPGAGSDDGWSWLLTDVRLDRDAVRHPVQPGAQGIAGADRARLAGEHQEGGLQG